MTISQAAIEFTKDAGVFDETQVASALKLAAEVTDLLVLSHGWNNDKDEAICLYNDLLKNMADVLAAGVVPRLNARKFGAICVYWPSKRFAEADLIPGGGAASATAENDASLVRQLEEMKRNPTRLGDTEVDHIRAANLTCAQELIPKLESDRAARREYVLRLRSILDPAAAHVDDGSKEFFTVDPEELFDHLQEGVVAPLGTLAEGTVQVEAAGGAASLGDLIDGVKAAARRIANFSTYYEMKERAGKVGRFGLGPILCRIRERQNDLPLHLIGHSFGGRLVTSAANVLPARTPAITLSLLQAAFSHNGLAENFDKRGSNGAFRELLADKRASGPVIITHTKNDKAVGIAYPLASRFSRDQAAALGDENDPYGGMGRNGAQHTPEAEGLSGGLQEVGEGYTFTTGKVYNLNADRFIQNHGDVTGHQVAYALLNAIAAT